MSVAPVANATSESFADKCDELVEAHSLHWLAVTVAVGRTRVAEFVSSPSAHAGAVRPVHNVWCLIKPAIAVEFLRVAEHHGICPRSPLAQQLPDPAAIAPRCQDLTFEQLLTHQAGLTRPNAADIRLSPRELHDTILRKMTPNPPQAPHIGYSEVAAWQVLCDAIGCLTKLESATRIQQYFDALVSDPSEAIIVSGELDRFAIIEPRIVPYFADDDARPIPLLHDLLPSVFAQCRPALGAYASATSICDWYARISERIAGHFGPNENFPSSEYLRRSLATIHSEGYDQVLQRECTYAAGMMTSFPSLPSRARTNDVVGHVGWAGSSIAIADLTTRMSVVVIHSDVDLNGTKSSDICSAVLDAAYQNFEIVCQLRIQ